MGSGTTDGFVFGISVAHADAAIAENYAGWAQIEKGWAEAMVHQMSLGAASPQWSED